MKQDLKSPSSIGSKASDYRLNVEVLGLGVFSTKNVTFFDFVLHHHSIFKPEVGFTFTVLIPEVTFFFFCQIVGVKKWIQ